jgi:lysophospholipase L1-like esterase
MWIDPLTKKYIVQNPERKAEFLDIMDRVGTRWRFLGDSPYNLHGSTCHPNPEGHKLWAEYVYSQIDK